MTLARPALLLAVVALLAGSATASARPAVPKTVPATYGDFSMMFSRSAGQYWSGGQAAGQWSWSPQSASVSDISWGSPTMWPPASAERFEHIGNTVVLDGYSAGQGKPVTTPQAVTSESIGSASCTGMTPLATTREVYAMWEIPAAGYCLDATGVIISGSVTVHFRHVQQWGPIAGCGNAYMLGKTCITQHEQWFDDNGHPYGLQINRTVYLASGLGMEFYACDSSKSPCGWTTDGRYFWSY